MSRYPCTRTDDCGLEIECGECESNPEARFENTLTLKMDGDQWCALLGKNLQEGNAGFGDTKTEALRGLADDLENSD